MTLLFRMYLYNRKYSILLLIKKTTGYNGKEDVQFEHPLFHGLWYLPNRCFAKR